MKRVAALILSALLVAAVFAGCSNGPAAPNTATPAAEEQTAQPKAVVRFMVGDGAKELEGYQEAVDAFNAQSQDVFVEMMGFPGDGYNEKVITQLSSNTAPDCFYAEEALFGELNNSGKLLDLTEYLDAGKYGLSRDDVPQGLIDSFTMNGKMTGVPVDSNPMLIYYNADLFQEVGIKTPQEYYDAGEWNFAALQEVSEKLRDAGKVGFVFENWWGPIYAMLLSKDVSPYTEDGKSSNFDDPRILAGMNYLEDNIESGAFVYVGDLGSGESPAGMFMSGQAGLVFAGRWFVPDFSELTLKWDVIPFPYYEKPGDEIAPTPSLPLVINADSENPEATWQFVSFYCGTQGQTIRTQGSGNAVPTVPGLDTLVLTGVPEHAQYFLDALNIAVSYPHEEAMHPGLTDMLTSEVEKVLVGDQDSAAAVANMKALADESLQE